MAGNDKQAILDQMKVFSDTFASQDAQAMYAKLYMPDAYIMPPGAPGRRGKEGVVGVLRDMMKSGMAEIKWDNDFLEIHDDIAIQRGRYEEDQADHTVMECGKTLTIWKKDAKTKQWRIMYDIWNKN